MNKKVGHNLSSFVLVILLFVFQLLAAHYNQIFISHLTYVEYGWENTLPVLATILFGDADALMENSEVQAAYLGG